jgi:hypothetical protein
MMSDHKPALHDGACDVCAERASLEDAAVTCSAHFVDWLNRHDPPPPRPVIYRQYGGDRG